ncbi:MAG: helix-turn-helix transcriptional regulator [Gammaproteobacteria bacterium]|nr:MAG: helix-turn-helix transcriptional regulator [Gammaproteobacteria bacterium]
MAFALSDNIDQLLLALYRGPLAGPEEPLWQGFLRLLRDELNADFATLLLRPPSAEDQGVVLNAVVVSPDVYTAYNETWFALDPFVDLPADRVMTLAEFLPRDVLEASDYYREYMAPIGVFHMLGVDMRPASGTDVRLRVTRGPGAPDFSEADRELVAALIPHIHQAVTLQSRIARTQSERDVYANAFGQLSLGAIILDEQGAVLHVNEAAEAIMAKPAQITVKAGQLQVGNRQQNQAFRDIVDEVMAAHRRSEPSFVRVFRLEKSDSLAGIGLLVRPLPRGALPEGQEVPAVAIFISDPETQRAAPVHILTQLFGFTPAEASLALLLANGLTLDEAATELDVSRNTVKSHLSAVFAKTGVNRQTQLVQLILKSVAPL